MLASGQSGVVAIPVTGADFKVAPMFGTTGTIISDPSGTILNAHQSGVADFKVAPMFGTNGAIISDPSGTILNANGAEAGGAAVPVPGADFKVAPMFDAMGNLVSDPSGTILSVINP